MRTRLISVKADRLSPIELASSERDIDPFSSKASIIFTYEDVATATGRPPLPSAGPDDPADLATRLPFCLSVAMQQNTSTPEPFFILLESSLPPWLEFRQCADWVSFAGYYWCPPGLRRKPPTCPLGRLLTRSKRT